MDITRKKREVVICSPEELKGSYDAIFLEFKVMPNLKPSDAAKVAKEAKELAKEVNKAVPNLHTLVYQDQDLEFLVKNLSEQQKKELPEFLLGLQNAGQITEEQRKKFSGSAVAISDESLELVLKWLPKILGHLNVKGSFSWPVRDLSVYFEDAQFFDAVVSSVDLEVEEGEGFLVIKKLPTLV